MRIWNERRDMWRRCPFDRVSPYVPRTTRGLTWVGLASSTAPVPAYFDQPAKPFGKRTGERFALDAVSALNREYRSFQYPPLWVCCSIP